MKLKALKTGRYDKRFIDVGEIIEVPNEIFDQYKDAFLTWTEEVNESQG